MFSTLTAVFECWPPFSNTWHKHLVQSYFVSNAQHDGENFTFEPFAVPFPSFSATLPSSLLQIPQPRTLSNSNLLQDQIARTSTVLHPRKPVIHTPPPSPRSTTTLSVLATTSPLYAKSFKPNVVDTHIHRVYLPSYHVGAHISIS